MKPDPQPQGSEEPKWVQHMRIATLDRIIPHESEYLAYVDRLIAERDAAVRTTIEQALRALQKLLDEGVEFRASPAYPAGTRTADLNDGINAIRALPAIGSTEKG